MESTMTSTTPSPTPSSVDRSKGLPRASAVVTTCWAGRCVCPNPCRGRAELVLAMHGPRPSLVSSAPVSSRELP